MKKKKSQRKTTLSRTTLRKLDAPTTDALLREIGDAHLAHARGGLYPTSTVIPCKPG